MRKDQYLRQCNNTLFHQVEFSIKCRLQIHVFPRLEGICFETSTYGNMISIKDTTPNVYNYDLNLRDNT